MESKILKFGYDENGESIGFDVLENEMQDKFVARLKKVVAEKGWTLRRLAEEMGVLPSSLQVGKKSMPSMKIILRYAEVVGVQPWDLLYDCGVSGVGVSGTPVPMKWKTQNELNQRIANMMRMRGLTQTKIAERMGVTQMVVSANLQSANMPLKIMIRFAKGLGVEPWELLIDREDMEREVRRRRGETESVQDVQQNGASVKENVQQEQIKTTANAVGTGAGAVADDTLPWDEEVLEARKASEADKRLSAIPLRVIRIIRCPYCQHELTISD